jgi:DNA-binding beta-propeller fold protein YncE
MKTAASIFILLVPMLGFADTITLVAGSGTKGDGAKATEAKLHQPFGCDFSADGSMVFVEFTGSERLRIVKPDGTIQTLAGTGQKGFSGNGEAGGQATFNALHAVLVAPDGMLYLADTFNHSVRTYDPKSNLVNLYAGTGTKGFSGDGGPALKSTIDEAYCIAADGAFETLYLIDLKNRRLRAIDMKTNIIRTVAGNGQKGVPKDGELAVHQPLVDPRAVAVDPKSGIVYLLERGGHALRVIDKAGRIKTVAGTGKAGAGETMLNGPKFATVDRDGSVLIADTENHRIVRYASGSAKLVTVAGTGKAGVAGLGGDPKLCELNKPHGVTVHPKTGEIYVCDSSNHRILKIMK